jgi:endoglucanase
MIDRSSVTRRAAAACGMLVVVLGVLSACGGAGDRADAAHQALGCRGSGATARSGHPAARPRSASASASASAIGLVRVNQVGYGVRCAKQAFLMTEAPFSGSFSVLPEGGGAPLVTAPVGTAVGSVNAHWPYVYRLDFSELSTPGRYVIAAGDLRSPVITVGDPMALYSPLVGRAVSFFTNQRDGPAVVPGPLRRRPSHLSDASATVYQRPVYRGLTLIGNLRPTPSRVNVAGGWFDAGDYLKFTETASFSEVMLLFTLREYPEAAPSVSALRAEATFGARWLLRMWDPRRRVLYDQVGIGDGNGGSILGDHDFWRLPQSDGSRHPRPGSPNYFIAHRPVFAANAPGRPISPNLAGRVAAALGLCAQVFAATDRSLARRCLRAGEQVYAAADLHPRTLVSSEPNAYYHEPEWRDDLALGGIELYRAARRFDGPRGFDHDFRTYLHPAAVWTDAYITAPNHGQDSLNLYDVSSLAYYDLVPVLRIPRTLTYATAHNIDLPTDPGALLSDLHDQLALASRLAGGDAFGLANPAVPTDTVPHALGYAIEARLYDTLSASAAFEPLAQNQIGWVLGSNAWGSSFIVGAGSVFPHCLAHQIANLSGSLDGQGALLRGATVDGPNGLASLTSLGAPDGYRPCPRSGTSPFSAFDGHGAGYVDDVRSSSTSEPSIDYTALALVAAAQQAEG